MENDTIIKHYLKDNPVYILSEKDLNSFVLKFGSLLFLLNNKNINPTFMFISLVKEESLQNIFIRMSGVPTIIEILKIILTCYPNLIKSKIVKDNSIRIVKNQAKRKQKHVSR